MGGGEGGRRKERKRGRDMGEAAGGRREREGQVNIER